MTRPTQFGGRALGPQRLTTRSVIESFTREPEEPEREPSSRSSTPRFPIFRSRGTKDSPRILGPRQGRHSSSHDGHVSASPALEPLTTPLLAPPSRLRPHSP